MKYLFRVVDRDHVYTLWTRGDRMFTGQFIIDAKNGSADCDLDNEL